MQASFLSTIRGWLRVLTKKLLTEVVVSSLATLLVMGMFSNILKSTSSPPSPAAGLAAGPTTAAGEKTADFMEQVALSHVVGLKPASTNPADAASPAPPAAPASVAASAPTPAPAVPTHVVAERRHERTLPSAVHVAAHVPDVLPPPRPTMAAADPIPAAETAMAVAPPQKTKSHSVIDYGLRPFRFGMHVVTDVVDFVPASGTRVVQGVASVGDAVTSFVKKL